MKLVSLPILVYVLPLSMLLTILLPVKWKRLSLFGTGLLYCALTGGFAGISLPLLSILMGWFNLWIQPNSDAKKKQRVLWQYVGVGMQILLLLLGKLLLEDALMMVPLLLCSLQGIERLTQPVQRIPSLADYACDACALPRMLAAPLLSHEEAEALWENRSVSAKEIGAGASLCIRGVFQLVCMAYPMQQLHHAVTKGGLLQHAMDCWFMLVVFYFACYYGLKGAAQLGQGMALLLGVRYPASFRTPLLANSIRDFFRRFMPSMQSWAGRVLKGVFSEDAWGHFAQQALLLGGIGFLVGKSSCGLFFGVFVALAETCERIFIKGKESTIPRLIRQIGTGLVLLLCMGFLRSETLTDSFSFFRILSGVDGIAMSEHIRFYLGTSWLRLLLCVAGLFPLQWVKKLIQRWKIGTKGLLWLLAEAGMLLISMAELMTDYLR